MSVFLFSVFMYLFKGSGLKSLMTVDESLMTIFMMNFGSFDVSQLRITDVSLYLII